MNKKLYLFNIILLLISCRSFAEELIPFSFEGKYGYVNRALQVIIEPRFVMANHFTTDGFAIVSFGTLNPGIIDIDGNVIKKLDYGFIRHIYGDLYHFDNSRTKDIIRIKDNKIIARQTDYPGITSEEGYILAEFINEENRYFFIDFDGNRVLTNLIMKNPSYSFYDQRARISNKDWDPQIIDMEGNKVGNISFVSLGQRYSEGLIPAKASDGVTGYVNKSGRFAFIVPFISDNTIPVATNFCGGYAAIRTSESPPIWKVINAQGRIVSGNILVNGMQDFSDGLSLVSIYNYEKKETKYGYVNTKGEYLVKPIFESADSFENGYARVVYNGQEGLLKTNGKIIWSSDIMKDSPIEKDLKWEDTRVIVTKFEEKKQVQ